MLVRHRLSTTKGENMLSHDRAALVAGNMKGYDINIAKIIMRDIYNREVSTVTNLEFLYLLTQICLEEGQSEI